MLMSKAAKFTKEQLVKSEKYFDKRDIVNVLLLDEKEYTTKEVDDMIEEFMKKAVN